VKALPFQFTKYFVHLVLNCPAEDARHDLYLELLRAGSNEGQFYQGIIDHQKGLRLTSEEWFELLSRLPLRVLRSGMNLRGVLSDEQIKLLPPVTG
jgi:hypothetical protein